MYYNIFIQIFKFFYSATLTKPLYINFCEFLTAKHLGSLRTNNS